MKNKKKVSVTLCTLALITTIAIGGTMAYLTDSEEATNKFTIGKVDIELTEPNWKEKENQDLEAGVAVKKDPTVTNTGINDAYVYLKVKIPRKSVITVDSNGVRKNNGTAVLQDLFSFTASKNWTLIDKTESSSATVYVYSYNKILSPKKSTDALFNTVTLANIVEGQIDGQTFEIPVDAFAIQAANTGDGSGNIPSEARAAYDKYLKQNNL